MMELTVNNKMVGFLGIGAAGNNICEIAEAYGYRTAIMNTSPEDLDAIANIKNKLLIGTNGGCGKDRNIAKQEVRNYYEDIIEFAKNKFTDEEIKIVYVTFSAGGGTGSGMAPVIIDLLNRSVPGKRFGALCILPSAEESSVAQYNTLENLNELSKLNVPMLIVDNDKFTCNQKLSKRQLFDTINRSIIDQFNSLFKERKSSKYGNLDNKDLAKLLLTPGVMSIATQKLFTDITDSATFTKKLASSWDRSIFVDLEYDNLVKRMGYIFEISDAMSKVIDYPSIEREIGKSLEIFEGFYAPTDTNDQTVISILTGLSFPEKRIKKIRTILEKARESITTSKKNITILGGDELNWFNSTREDDLFSSTLGEGGTPSDGDLEDIFSKF